MVNILKNVEINELLKIDIFAPNVYAPGEIEVSIDAVEAGKRVIIDEDASRVLGDILMNRANDSFESVRDPKMKKDMEEFVARMCVEWHRNGLLIIEDLPDNPTDPYEEAKAKVTQALKNVGR